MTALAWVLLGELLLIVLAVAAASALAVRHRRRKTLEALNILLDKLKQDEASRLSTLRQQIAHHPVAFGTDAAAIAERWLGSEKEFVRALLPVLLAGDVAAIARLDEPLRRMLDERLPRDAAAHEILDAEQTTSQPGDSGRAESSAGYAFAVADAAGSTEFTLAEPEIPASHAGESEIGFTMPESDIARSGADLWDEMSALAEAVAATPAVATEPSETVISDEGTGELLEQAFWADMGLTDTPLDTVVEPDLEPAVGVVDDASGPANRGEIPPVAAGELPGVVLSLDDQPYRPADQASPENEEPSAADSRVMEGSDADEPVETASVPDPELPPDVDPVASTVEPDALDMEIWEELKALALVVQAEKAQKEETDSTPSAEQQDQPAAAEQTGQQ